MSAATCQAVINLVFFSASLLGSLISAGTFAQAQRRHTTRQRGGRAVPLPGALLYQWTPEASARQGQPQQQVVGTCQRPDALLKSKSKRQPKLFMSNSKALPLGERDSNPRP